MKDWVISSQELICEDLKVTNVCSMIRRSCSEHLGYQTRDCENTSSTKPLRQ